MKKKPVYIQLSRKSGFKLQEISRSKNGLSAISCARPGRWGNPCIVTPETSRAHAVEAFKSMLKKGKTPPFALANIRDELRGKNLACWCPDDGQPCHARVLMEIANA